MSKNSNNLLIWIIVGGFFGTSFMETKTYLGIIQETQKIETSVSNLEAKVDAMEKAAKAQTKTTTIQTEPQTKCDSDILVENQCIDVLGACDAFNIQQHCCRGMACVSGRCIITGDVF